MKEVITYNPDRKKLIDNYKKEDNKVYTRKIPFRGNIPKPIYKIPLDILYYNKYNGRVKAQVMNHEKMKGELDVTKPKHAKVIEEMLWKIDESDNPRTLNDLEQYTQLEPGVITCDGIIINGNRRKMLLEILYKKTKRSEFQFFDTFILPENVKPKELWLLEANIQLSQERQVEYKPINRLLKFREGVVKGLKVEDIVGHLRGYNREYLETSIKILELMDEYLDDFIGKLYHYHLVDGKHQHFGDLLSIIQGYKQHKRGRGAPNWSPEQKDLNELKIVGFYWIRQGMSFLKIRQLNKRFRDLSVWHKTKVIIEEEQPEAEAGVTRKQEVLGVDEEDIRAQREEETSISRYSTIKIDKDKAEEREWQRKHHEIVARAYKDSEEQIRINEERDKPERLLQRVIGILESIDSKHEDFKKASVDEKLSEIILLVNKLRKTHKEHT